MDKKKWNDDFFDACKNGQVDEMKGFIHEHHKRGFGEGHWDEIKNEALIWAGRNRQWEVVEYLLTSKDFKEWKYRPAEAGSGHNALFVEACRSGDLKWVRFLLTSPSMKMKGEWNQEVNLHDNDEAGLRGAAAHGHLDVVKYLLTSQELIEAGHTWANVHEAHDFALRYAKEHVVRWLVIDYGIKKTPAIETWIKKYHPKVQEYFDVRQEMEALQKTVQNIEDRQEEGLGGSMEQKRAAKAKKL